MQILQPLAGPKVGEAVRKTVNEMFGVFAQSMAAAFQKFMRPDGTFPPRLGEQIVSHPCWPHSADQRSDSRLMGTSSEHGLELCGITPCCAHATQGFLIMAE